MGNNNSRNSEDIQNTANATKFNNQTKANMYKKANQMYNDIWDSEDQSKYEVYKDNARGINMPYYSSDGKQDMMVSSEYPKYVEFVVCAEDINNLRDVKEKYAVNKSTPDHNCVGNCYCIEETIEFLGNKRRVLSNNNIISPTSDALSETSEIPKIKDNKKSNIAIIRNNNVSGGCAKKDYSWAGVNNKTANTNAPEPKVAIIRNTNLKGGARNNMDDSPVETVDLDDTEDDLMFSNTSDLTSTPTIKKKQNKDDEIVNADDEDDDIDDDDDLEGLEEELTEDGFDFDQSDMDSTDLYKMTNNIFVSQTDSDNYQNNRIYDDDVDSITEKVRVAMNKPNYRLNKNLYNSEDLDILQMNSSSDNYSKKPVKKNNKYN